MWGGLFKTIKDMGKHTFYHCGDNDGNPFKNNSNGGVIDRRTMCGFGLPIDDMFMSKGRVMYDKIKKNGYVLSVISIEGDTDGAKYVDMLHPHTVSNQD